MSKPSYLGFIFNFESVDSYAKIIFKNYVQPDHLNHNNQVLVCLVPPCLLKVTMVSTKKQQKTTNFKGGQVVAKLNGIPGQMPRCRSISRSKHCKKSTPFFMTGLPTPPTWMSQEVSKWLGSVLYPQYTPFISRL